MKTLVCRAEGSAAEDGRAGITTGKCRPRPPPRPKTAPKQLQTASADEAPAPVLRTTSPGTYTTITALSELDLWIQRARRAGLYAFDVETDGTDEMSARPLGFSLSVEEGKACYIPIRAAGVTCIPEETVKQRLASSWKIPRSAWSARTRSTTTR